MSAETDLIAKQAIQIDALERELGWMRKALMDILGHLTCFDGPLNGNKKEYSKEQLKPFRAIQGIVQNSL